MEFFKKFFSLLLIIGVVYGVVVIATSAQVTSDNRMVDLYITAPSFVQNIQVDDNAGFATPRTFDASGPIRVDVCDGQVECAAGSYVLFVRYIDTANVVRHTTQQTVVFSPPPPPPEPEPVIEPELPPEPEPAQDTDPAPIQSDNSDSGTAPEPEPVVTPEPVVPTPIPEPTPALVAVAEFAQEPAVQTTVTTVAAVGVAGSAAASTASVVSAGFQVQQIGLAFVRLWNMILVFLGIRRRSQPWGVVFDSQTKQPLDPVVVELLDPEGNQVETSITDIYGRYGFFVEKAGQYFLRAGKTNYTFPSASKGSRATDMFYDELYYGTPIELAPADVITKNIPMDPAGADWNQAEKKRMKVGGLSPAVVLLTKAVFYAGLVFTIVTALAHPNTLSIVFLFLYLFMQILELLGVKTKSFGVIRDAVSGRGVAHAVITVMNAALDHRVARAESDEKGRYYALVPKGEYYLRVEEVDGKKLKKPLVTEAFRVRGGMVSKKVSV